MTSFRTLIQTDHKFTELLHAANSNHAKALEFGAYLCELQANEISNGSNFKNNVNMMRKY